MAFYDLTTVEITGQAVVADDVRAYGRSKSGPVARQFMPLAGADRRGLAHRPPGAPGNIAEAKTLLPMIKSLGLVIAHDTKWRTCRAGLCHPTASHLQRH